MNSININITRSNMDFILHMFWLEIINQHPSGVRGEITFPLAANHLESLVYRRLHVTYLAAAQIWFLPKRILLRIRGAKQET